MARKTWTGGTSSRPGESPASQAAGQTGDDARLIYYKLTHASLLPMWEDYLQDQDFDGLIDTLTEAVLDSAWDGEDLNGGGEITQEDRYIKEYRDWLDGLGN